MLPIVGTSDTLLSFRPCEYSRHQHESHRNIITFRGDIFAEERTKSTDVYPAIGQFSASTINMARTKVVVTRRLIDEAQEILEAKKGELEIVQWDSEKVCRFVGTWMPTADDALAMSTLR